MAENYLEPFRGRVYVFCVLHFIHKTCKTVLTGSTDVRIPYGQNESYTLLRLTCDLNPVWSGSRVRYGFVDQFQIFMENPHIHKKKKEVCRPFLPCPLSPHSPFNKHSAVSLYTYTHSRARACIPYDVGYAQSIKYCSLLLLAVINIL